MTLEDFLSYVREEFLEDTVLPYLWSEAILLQTANLAESEACRRAELLIDNTSYPITTVATTSEYSLDTAILNIHRMHYADNTGEIKHKLLSYLKSNYILEDQPGKPSIYIYSATDKIKLLPVPDEEYIISITASVLPVNRAKSILDSFEIGEKYQADLAYFVAGRAFNSPDIDKRDKDKSLEMFAMFDRIFGAKLSARAEVSRKQLPKGEGILAYPQRFGFV